VDAEEDKESDEEENNIHDAERETGLEHRARLIQMQAKRIRNAAAPRKDSNIEAARVRIPLTPLRTIPLGDGAEIVDASNQSADEEQVDNGDEHGGVAGRVVGDKRRQSPDGGEDGDDEEDEDHGGRESHLLGEAVDEPREHADDGDEGEELEDAPYGEGDAVEHACGWDVDDAMDAGESW